MRISHGKKKKRKESGRIDGSFFFAYNVRFFSAVGEKIAHDITRRGHDGERERGSNSRWIVADATEHR